MVPGLFSQGGALQWRENISEKRTEKNPNCQNKSALKGDNLTFFSVRMVLYFVLESLGYASTVRLPHGAHSFNTNPIFEVSNQFYFFPLDFFLIFVYPFITG